MWSSDRRRLLAAVPLALGAAACGFSPLYAPGSPAEGMIGRVDVAPMQGSAGFTLRERLVERLGSPQDAAWRLVVDLELDRTGVALTEENFTTRYNIVGTAAFALRPAGGGPALIDDSVRAITGYAAPDTETAVVFATRAAERDAELRLARTLADRIVQRLAVTAPDWAA